MVRLHGYPPTYFPSTNTWRGGEVETRESAKLLCTGSIPVHASNLFDFGPLFRYRKNVIQILNRALWVVFLVLTPLTFIGVLSQNSIPGDFLYSIKRGYEGTALAFASLAPETKASYTTSLATVRFTEAEKLLLAKSDTQGLATLVEQVQTAQDNVAAVQNVEQKEELEQKLIASIDTYQASLLKVQQQIATNVASQPITQTTSAQTQPTTSQTAQTTSPSSTQPTQTAIPTPTTTQSSSQTTQLTQTPTPTTPQAEEIITTTPIATQVPSTTPTTTQIPPPAGTPTTTPESRAKIDEEIEKTKEKLDEIRKKVKSQRNQQVENSTSDRDNGRGDSERRNDDDRK